MGARFVQTTRDKAAPVGTEPPADPVLVIANHPSLARVGDAFVLRDRITEIGRLAPLFGRDADRSEAPGRDAAPLDDPFVSRTAIVIRRVDREKERSDAGRDANRSDPSRGSDPSRRGSGSDPNGDVPYDLEIDANGVELAIAGLAITGKRRISHAELSAGIDLVLGGRVVLWLTTTREHAGLSDELGMVGASAVVADLRRAIREVAPATNAGGATRGPVLVLGETGTGKELVARAIHACVRPDGPYAAVNIAAIPAAVATAELFGHEKGAFTGATERRAGYFERASSGVLFLDEIGDLAESIQPILLRTLESGEIQPVGGMPRTVDTFVVAATDADLDRAASGGIATPTRSPDSAAAASTPFDRSPNRFRAPLYHRLAATTLRVPPLRERRGDIGPLLAKFLIDELALGHAALDRTTDANAWLPASLVADLIRATWPGNIRQLRAIALRLATIARANRTATLDTLGPGLGIDDEETSDAGDAATADAAEPVHTAGAADTAHAADAAPDAAHGASHDAALAASHDADSRGPIDERTLAATLREHRFHLARTAEALGISRTHLDALIAKSSSLRKAKDLTSAQIVAAREQSGDDLDALAAKLEVSPRGLRLRMRQLGIE